MSKEYLAVNGLRYYLIDLLNDEGYVFSDMGQGIDRVNAKYVVSVCNVLVPVDILSILHDSTTSISEIYYRGYKQIVRGSAIKLYRDIPKSFERGSYVPFRILRSEQVGLIQILVPFKKDCVTLDSIKNLYRG